MELFFLINFVDVPYNPSPHTPALDHAAPAPPSPPPSHETSSPSVKVIKCYCKSLNLAKKRIFFC